MPTTTQLQSADMRQAALRELARMGLLALSAGAGVRGLQGLLSLGGKNLADKPAPPPTVYLQPAHHEEKYAAETGLLSSAINTARSAGNSLVEPFQKAFRGEGLTSPTGLPWFIPAAMAGVPLAAYGGYQAADKLLDRRRRKSLESELEAAKKEYEAALAGTSKLGQALDQVCDSLLDKQGFISPDTAGAMTGAGLTVAGLIALLSGKATYELTKKQRPSELLDKAKDQRKRRQLTTTGWPVMAQPASLMPT